MGYSNKFFIELKDWLYVRYGKIISVDLIPNQEETQASYKIKDPIEILFDQI